MPHVSGKKLDPMLLEKLFGKLLMILNQAQNRGHLSTIVNELFTSTEKIMVSKRLAIILMLSSHTPQHRIVDLLKVSPATVSKMSLKKEIGKYKVILKISQKEKSSIEKLIWGILTAGGIMPPKIGRKYWMKHIK